MPGRISTAQGTITGAISAAPIGQIATSAQGTITPEIAVVLTGLGVTTAQGTLNVLGGLRATTAQGALTPVISVGTASSTSVVPQVPVLTGVRLLSSGTPDPRIMRTQFLSANGKLYGTAEWINITNLALNSRRTGTMIVDQKTHETFTWTESGSALSSANQLDLAANPAVTDQLFPRLGALPSGPGIGWPVYTTATYQGGWLSLDPDGNIQSAYSRTLIQTTGFTTVNPTIQNQRGAGYTEFMAWQAGDLGAGNYNGPELFLGRNVQPSVTRTVPTTASNFAPMGIYAVSQYDTLAFYTRPVDLSVVGDQIGLTFCKVTLTSGVITPLVDNGGATLVGLRATTAAGTVTPVDASSTIYQPLTGLQAIGWPKDFSSPSFFVGSVSVPLLGLQATTASPQFSIVPHNPQQGVGVAFRRLQIVDPTLNADPAGYRWGNETLVTTVSGTDAIWTLPEHLTVVPSGYGDVVYVIYLHSQPDAQRTESIGVLVMNAYTGNVISNTVTTATPWATAGTWYPSQETTRNVTQERSVAQVVKISSGSSVTQFLFDRNIVNLSWTAATATAPTLTIKSGPSISDYLIPGFEHLETRGDEVVHVLYGTKISFSHIKEDLGRVYVNDATSTSSTWTTVSSTATVDGSSTTFLQPIGSFGGSFEYNNDHYSGSGSGQQSFLYTQRWSEFFSTTREDTAAVWVDYWNAQPKLMSVAAEGRVGRVGTIVSNPVFQALTGLRATTSQGSITPEFFIRLTGQVATTAQGVLGLGDMYSLLTGQVATTAQGILYTYEGHLTGQRINTFQGAMQFPVILQGMRLTLTTNPPGLGSIVMPYLRATLVPGTLIVTTDAGAVTLSGLRATIAQGALQKTIDKALTGQPATTGQGALGAQIARLLTGGLATTSAGVLTPSIANTTAPSGLLATSAQGVLLASVPAGATLSGRLATMAQGVMQQTIDKAFAGGMATTAAGVLTPLLAVVLSGLRGTTAQGALSVAVDRALTGLRATTAAGALGFTYDSSVVVTGVQATGYVGDVASAFPAEKAKNDLWAAAGDTSGKLQTTPPDLFVVTS